MLKCLRWRKIIRKVKISTTKERNNLMSQTITWRCKVYKMHRILNIYSNFHNLNITEWRHKTNEEIIVRKSLIYDMKDNVMIVNINTMIFSKIISIFSFFLPLFVFLSSEFLERCLLLFLFCFMSYYGM